MIAALREIYSSEKLLVAFVSIWAAVFLTTIKLLVGFHSGSLGIIAEAAHSGMDLGAAIITFWAVRASSRPPDHKHQFGHDKFENLAALFETLILIATCFWIAYEAVEKLLGVTTEIKHSIWTYGVMLISIGVDTGRTRALTRVAKKYKSQALEADALHFKTDIMSSMVVIIGLIAAQLGFLLADPVAALIVSAFVLVQSFRLGKNCIEALLDTAPEEIEDQVAKIFKETEENVSFDNLRIRGSKHKPFINLDMSIGRLLTFEESHKLVHKIQNQIKTVIPGSDVVIHANPVRDDEKEKIFDALRFRAHESNIHIHHIHITEVDEKYLVEFHMECAKNWTLDKAISVSENLKKLIYSELRNIKDIHIHLEETYDFDRAENISGQFKKEITEIRKETLDLPNIQDCYDIMIMRMSDESLSLSLHCVLSKELSIKQVHLSTNEVETALKQKYPQFRRVLIHAEPLN